MAYEGLQARFLEELRARGGSAGNGAMREALGVADATYERVRDALEEAGRIERGRGRGGSVRLLDAAPAQTAQDRAPAPARQSAPPAMPAVAPAARRAAATRVEVEAYRHADATRRNIPTAEYESVLSPEEKTPIRLAYARRNRDLDPQLVWRGKDEADAAPLSVAAPPLYIQEKVHPQVIIEDLRRRSRERAAARADDAMPDLFADFNGVPKGGATEFYRHEGHWSNRMILGDSLAVMASLAEREGLRGKVQCIYFDPPYGIRFNSNFQWSTTTRDVKDGDRSHVTREPEQVRAFRDTWRDGIHSYLTYLRDRLEVARDLLHESGSIFVQIGDENVHRVRAVMDEVFGEDNFVAQIMFRKTTGRGADLVDATVDFILFYARSKKQVKFRKTYEPRDPLTDQNLRLIELPDGTRRSIRQEEAAGKQRLPDGARLYRQNPITSPRPPGQGDLTEYAFRGYILRPGKGTFKSNSQGLARLDRADRLLRSGNTLGFLRYFDDFPLQTSGDIWDDTRQSGFGESKIYVVQTTPRAIERCILMVTDPGDLVLDPTCGSGTTATVAEQWGRRWITIDTSRVALALTRSRLMGARYPYYLLANTPEGQRKEAEVTRTAPKTATTHGNIRQGFVYERVPHVTLKSIANNAEIDVIWETFGARLEPLRAALNAALVTSWQEWEIPRDADLKWPGPARDAHAAWWEGRIARQREMDASIAAKAEVEYLYDKPYEDRARTRVAGPFTVESLAPHRALTVDWDDSLKDPLKAPGLAEPQSGLVADFATMILDNLRRAGVQQSSKEDRITFTTLVPWPGEHVAAEGRFMEGDVERRAAILIGPEFGTVSRPDLVAAAREAGDAGFDVLIACAFAYDAHSTEFDRLGRVRVLRARMNPDLHMAKDLKATEHGNLFVIFGEPDIRIEDAADGEIRVRIRGVDVFKPQTGEVQSEGVDGIALWMLDTDYNEESFFVRHAYFLGANDPYKALKTTVRAEVDEEAWASLNSEVSRPFPKPASGRIAVKVINHLGDEVMKVFAVR